MPNNNYIEEDVENALKHHREQGISLRKCEFKFNVPKSTLIERNKSRNADQHGSGRPTALSVETEKLLIHLIQCFSDRSYGLTPADIISIVQHYLKNTKQEHLIKNGKPSLQWWYDFKERWNHDVALRKSDNITSNRASSCTSNIVDKYFNK